MAKIKSFNESLKESAYKELKDFKNDLPTESIDSLTEGYYHWRTYIRDCQKDKLELYQLFYENRLDEEKFKNKLENISIRINFFEQLLSEIIYELAERAKK